MTADNQDSDNLHTGGTEGWNSRNIDNTRFIPESNLPELSDTENLEIEYEAAERFKTPLGIPEIQKDAARMGFRVGYSLCLRRMKGEREELKRQIETMQEDNQRMADQLLQNDEP